ncbi:MAG TPA: hypothetical protein VLF64_00185 [Candidatus Saccharimonadales bacterium]|nr:hypothetical protein [Candidatus Chromulinivoraceae bacterium]HSW90397.1 hypothetical protein [Candidatus Saccharimonadales bacterium]
MTERDYQTRRIQQEGQPEVIPDYVPQSIENNGHGWPTWLKRTVGGVAAATALAAGIAAGVGATSNHNSSKEGQRPAATASATPGETASTTPSSPAETAPVTLEITADSYVFRDQGNTYTGETAFVAAIQKEFEAPTGLEAAQKVPNLLNEWVNSGLNKSEVTQDGMYNMQQVVALYDEAYSTALTGAQYSTLGEDMKSLHAQALTGYAWTHSQPQNEQDYKMEITGKFFDWMKVNDDTHVNATITATETYSKSTGNNTSQDFPVGFDINTQNGANTFLDWGPRATS